MATRSERLNRLVIGSPCTASWDAMGGDGPRRFCAECQREVYDFAQMTAASIHAELQASRGRMCARLTKRNGRLVTAPPAELARTPVPTRGRASAVAATLVTAWLAAANAQAQRDASAAPAAVDGSANESEPERSPARRGANDATGALLGRVVDENGAPVAGVDVIANNALDGSVHRLTTGGDGTFRFDALLAGMYDVTGEGRDYDGFDSREGIVVQAGEQQRADLTARRQVITVMGATAVSEPYLRTLFGESEVVVSGVLGPSTVVEREGEDLTVATEVRVGTVFKGKLTARTLVYRHEEWESEGEWAAEHAPGTRVLAFLVAAEDVESSARPIFEVAAYSSGVKRVSEAEQAAYEARLEALARIERRAERRGEQDPDDIVEWLVATTEQRLTRSEALSELVDAVNALAERAEATSASIEVAAADLRLLVDRFRGGGGMLSAEPRPALLGAAMTVDHRQRLTAALLATEGWSDGSWELFVLVHKWDAASAREWVLRRLRAAEATWDGEVGGWMWLLSLAEELDEDALEGLVTEAQERENEIASLWPGDDSEETTKLRRERLAELHRELRHRFAQALAATP